MRVARYAWWEATEIARDAYVASWLALMVSLGYALTYAFGLARTAYAMRFLFVLVPLGFLFLFVGRGAAAHEVAFRKLLATQAVDERTVFWGRALGQILLVGVYLLCVLPAAILFAVSLPAMAWTVAFAFAGGALLGVGAVFGSLLLSARPYPRALLAAGGVFGVLFAAQALVAIANDGTFLLQWVLALFPVVPAAYAASAIFDMDASRPLALLAMAAGVAVLGVLARGRWIPARARRLRSGALALLLAALLAACGALAATTEETSDPLQIRASGAFNLGFKHPSGEAAEFQLRLSVGEPHSLILVASRIAPPTSAPREVTLQFSGAGINARPAGATLTTQQQTLEVPIVLTLTPLENGEEQPYVLHVTWNEARTSLESSVILKGDIEGMRVGLRAAALAAIVPLIPWALHARRPPDKPGPHSAV